MVLIRSINPNTNPIPPIQSNRPSGLEERSYCSPRHVVGMAYHARTQGTTMRVDDVACKGPGRRCSHGCRMPQETMIICLALEPDSVRPARRRQRHARPQHRDQARHPAAGDGRHAARRRRRGIRRRQGRQESDGHRSARHGRACHRQNCSPLQHFLTKFPTILLVALDGGERLLGLVPVGPHSERPCPWSAPSTAV